MQLYIQHYPATHTAHYEYALTVTYLRVCVRARSHLSTSIICTKASLSEDGVER